MGRVVDFHSIEMRPAGAGVTLGRITDGGTRELVADLARIAKGKIWQSAVPAGCDVYVFAVSGAGVITAGNYRQDLPLHAYATIGEGVGFTIEAVGNGLEVVVVTAPPPGTARRGPGFAAALDVKVRAQQPVVDVPDQLKRRTYFCGPAHGTPTGRAHAMIVDYARDTTTALHHHPNAESLFVLIAGACAFSIDGQSTLVRPGQAAYFGIDDRHGLATAPGESGASFLEFHVPAAFSTVKA